MSKQNNTELKCINCEKIFTQKNNFIRHKMCCEVNLIIMKNGIQERISTNETQEIIKLINKNKMCVNSKLTYGSEATNASKENKLLDFRDSTYDHLIDVHYLYAIDKLFLMVPKIVEMVHFSPYAKHNHNIYIKNFRSKLVYIYNGSAWEIHNEKEIIDKLIMRSECEIEEFINKKEFENLRKIINKYNDKSRDKKMQKYIYDNVKLVLYSRRHVPFYV
jgi:hypothetical protein